MIIYYFKLCLLFNQIEGSIKFKNLDISAGCGISGSSVESQWYFLSWSRYPAEARRSDEPLFYPQAQGQQGHDFRHQKRG